MAAIESDILTLEEASQFLNLKISRIRNLVFKKRIPYIKIGASVLFSKSELINWININSYKA